MLKNLFRLTEAKSLKDQIAISGYFLKEATKKGDVWKIMIIETGWSHNGFHYSKDVLTEAIPLFEGIKSFAFKFDDKLFSHLPEGLDPDKFSKDVAGWIDKVKFEKVTVGGKVKEGLTGMFHATDKDIKETVMGAWKEKKKDLLGFSIDAEGELEEAVIDGQKGHRVTKIQGASSVDVVTFPSAGGGFLRLVADDLQEVDPKFHSCVKKVIAGGKTQSQAFAICTRTLGRGPKRKKTRGGFEMEPKLIELLAKLVRENPELIKKEKIEEGVDLDKLEDEKIVELLGFKIKEDEETPEQKEEREKKEKEAADKKIEEDAETETPEEKTAREEKEKKAEADKTQEALDNKEAMNKIIEALSSKNDDKINEALELLKDLQKKEADSKTAKISEADKKREEDHKKKITELDTVIEKANIRESQGEMKRLLESEIVLPQAIKDKIAKRHGDKVVDIKSLQEDIKEEKEVLARLSESDEISGLGRMEMGDDMGDRCQKACDLMMGYEPDESEKEAYKDIKPFKSLQEAYKTMTGDNEIRGKNNPRITEAITTDFPQAMGTSMERRMVKEYKRLMQKEVWSKLVSSVGVDNFKQQDIIRIGGLANIPIVAENGAYTFAASPSEESANYTPQKRGQLLFITREILKNDDLRTVRRWPIKFAQAANRTLSVYIYDLILNAAAGVINAGVIYDGAALYTNAKGNLTTNNLDFNSLDAGITAMANQAEQTSGEVLGINAAFLLVPFEQRSLAKVLIDSEKRPIVATTNGVATGTEESANPNFKAVEPLIIPNYYLRSDTNNWFLIANKADVETIEMGFIDNRQEPEILLQDAPTVGTVFTQDRITYKVRHEYNGAVIDYRGFYAGIPAGLS